MKAWILFSLTLCISLPLFADPIPISQHILLNTQDEWQSLTLAQSNADHFNSHNQLFQSRFNPALSIGDIQAFTLTLNNNQAQLNPSWNAAALLQTQTQRTLLSYNSATHQGIEFTWAQFSSAQQQRLNTSALSLVNPNAVTSSPLSAGAALVNYIAGDHSYECTSNQCTAAYAMRARSQQLGDIVNSQLVYVGAPDPYLSNETDYQNFVKQQQTRPRLLLVGSNDGMLHAFNADSGEEIFAYIPDALLDNLAEYASVGYQHRYFVDGQISVKTVKLNQQWRTIAVFGLGAGGKSYTAIDITNPNLMNASAVLWEFNAPELGYSYATPLISLLHTQQWGVIVGNGYNSANQVASLLIIDLESGQLIRTIVAHISTQAMAANMNIAHCDSTLQLTHVSNGLSSANAVRLNTDNPFAAVDYAYAGDLYGNLWRFDLTSSLVANWDVSALYTPNTVLSNPITQAPLILKSLSPKAPYRLLLSTGKLLSESDRLTQNNQTQYHIALLDNPSLPSTLTWAHFTEKTDEQSVWQDRNWYQPLKPKEQTIQGPLWQANQRWAEVTTVQTSSNCQDPLMRYSYRIKPYATLFSSIAEQQLLDLNAKPLLQGPHISVGLEHDLLFVGDPKTPVTLTPALIHNPQYGQLSWRELY